MTFDEIFDQAIEMLQRRGRVSYRALKAQFHLDDDRLETLKDELVEVHQLATDQDGIMLVWTGAAGTTPEATYAPSAQPEVTQEAQAAPVESPPTERPAPDAERRQLTVMFCDLVDSTPLSQQLDPEDLRGVIRAYQETCAAVIQRFDGYIARYMGDGLLVYFGYPQAHENDAQRAGHAGLGIVEAVGRLNTRLEREHGVRLAVRIGIHTGLVVIETIGAGLAREHQALGETPNIAARLQMSAQPNTVMISAATHGLVQGYFACHDLGSHTLKGMLTPLQRYHVLGESGRKAASAPLPLLGSHP